MTGKTRGLTIIAACAALTMVGVLAYGQGASHHGKTMSKQQKIGYSIGYRIGQSFQKQGIAVDPDVVAAGIKAGMGKTKPKLDEQQMQATMMAFQQAMMKKAQAKQQASAKKNAATSSAFLAANAKKPGVHVTKSGLQYKIIKKGSGAKPGPKDTVKVTYKGTLPNGKKFDASADHGGPATFQVNRVIPGWTQALQMMRPGSEWRIWLPAKLAYGKRGAGSTIGPNQALVFDVKLLKVKKAKNHAKKNSKTQTK